MATPTPITVSSTISSQSFLQKAELLATKLQLPYSPSPGKTGSDLLLAFTEQGLQLLKHDPGKNNQKTLLFVDFVHGKNGYRLAKNCTTKQPLARAIGIKPGYRPTVLDATAGLGSDSFVFAGLGCQVSMCERNSIIAALLADGISRAQNDTRTQAIFNNNLVLMKKDALCFLQGSDSHFDSIYLDPMYPHNSRAAMNKQPLRVIRSLVGENSDCGKLLRVAIQRTKERVVVKRPKKAPYLYDLPPTHSILMKSSRFDVYLKNT